MRSLSTFCLSLSGLLLLTASANAQLIDFKSGHLKGQYLLGTYPDDSLFRDFIGTPSHDFNADLRLLIGGRKNKWAWQADYQLIARSGDTLELNHLLNNNFLVPNTAQNDDRRLINLTHTITENDDRFLLHRLDRFHVNYTGDKTVLKIGRQAISWGNGLIYNPVDFFNPFDPAAIDKEYKTGDDMIYGQYLQNSGNDWQFVSVFRNNDLGNTSHKINTYALKYHAFIRGGEQELDILLSQHYDDEIFSVGGITSWGGAIARGDVLITHTDIDTYFSAVTNLTYSWVWGGKNIIGIFEYFYNGMGLHEDEYSDLASNPDLIARLNRGELFTLGRHHLAGGLTIEMSPLIHLSPNLFANLEDNSGLAQLVGQYDVKQNWQILVALNVPFGGKNTEFRGLDSGLTGKQFSSSSSLFAQLAFYF